MNQLRYWIFPNLYYQNFQLKYQKAKGGDHYFLQNDKTCSIDLFLDLGLKKWQNILFDKKKFLSKLNFKFKEKEGSNILQDQIRLKSFLVLVEENHSEITKEWEFLYRSNCFYFSEVE